VRVNLNKLLVQDETEEYLLQFISKDFQYLTQQVKLQFNGVNLKCSYLINIIHELLIKYYFSNNVDVKFNLSSTILKKKYGEHYNYYIDYLCTNGFMSLVSKYYVGKKTNTYKLDSKYVYDVIRWKNNDNFLIKKSKNRLETSITELTKSSIDPDVRIKLVESLSKIKIDYEGALLYLKDLKLKNLIDDSKYQKNLISIENININNIYINFDDFGRFHTNFTILKKEIRNEFLTINNEMLTEIDIKNSQPLFFAVYLKDELFTDINGDTKKYFDLVKSGLLYDDIIQNSSVTDRNQAKEIIYKVLFGNNKSNKKENAIFQQLYPSVFEYICEYKELRDSYRELAHDLQRKESNFIFNKVIKEVFETYPDIILFTVHDSIMFSKSYQERVEVIFNKHFQKLVEKL
jgi:hypothetical protein